MAYTYHHLKRNEHAGCEGDRYSASEQTIEFRGRTVLCQYVDATAVNFCTASGTSYVGSINVKGYVLRWKYAVDHAGDAVSELEPVTDKEERLALSEKLWPGPGRSRVQFSDGPQQETRLPGMKEGGQ